MDKRFTTASIISRIAHDESWGGPADWIIGYEDRFLGVMEKSYTDFTRESVKDPNSIEGIPQHRIIYFTRASTGARLTRANKYCEAATMPLPATDMEVDSASDMEVDSDTGARVASASVSASASGGGSSGDGGSGGTS